MAVNERVEKTAELAALAKKLSELKDAGNFILEMHARQLLNVDAIDQDALFELILSCESVSVRGEDKIEFKFLSPAKDKEWKLVFGRTDEGDIYATLKCHSTDPKVFMVEFSGDLDKITNISVHREEIVDDVLRPILQVYCMNPKFDSEEGYIKVYPEGARFLLPGESSVHYEIRFLDETLS